MDRKSIFIDESNKIHNNKYDYSLVDYKNNKIKVKIICPIHGIFEQIPKEHKNNKQGCPSCGGTKRKDTDKFILDAIKIHGNKYDYSLVEYKNNKTKVKIICPIHGIFVQRPDSHLNGRGCINCSGKYKKNNNLFIQESIKVHGNKYDYSLVKYMNNKTKVKIICSIHNNFNQIPSDHLRGIGCPYCNESKGEKRIRLFLDKNKIKYFQQKTFKKCKYKRMLKFDFYIPEYDIVIEYNGSQHYKINEFFGGKEEYFNLKKRDNIKKDYCKLHGICMLNISYNQFDDIEDILINTLKN